ncbi:MAG: VWA domain-containing protein [Planctomycetaceae bacterium]|nr:VWA domain-containing protein [Planctomycetaceae bacterium]
MAPSDSERIDPAPRSQPPHPPGGVIHTYQKYDPKAFPSPTQPPPDLVSPAFEHLLEWGSMRQLTEEELANAIRLDPGQFSGLGPSLEAMIRMLEERRRQILETYESRSARKKAGRQFAQEATEARPPKELARPFHRAVHEEQIYDMESLWYRAERKDPAFARQLLHLMETLGHKYQIDVLDSEYEFTGTQSLDIPKAIEILQELQQIDQLLKQLKEARENARIAIIDLEQLSDFANPESIEQLRQFQEQVQQYLKDLMEGQGITSQSGAIQLSPRAFRLFQGKLLERIFSNLQASRSGRHTNSVEGDGAVELQRTRPFEFGDSVSQMDIPATIHNAMLRQGHQRPIRLRTDDIEIHRSRNNPKCATAVLMDMSGSMRYDGQYINVKRMALALSGLISREYPGDVLRFLEISTFARLVPPGDLLSLMPKIPTIHDPIVRLKADMSQEGITEYHIPPHFTNIQHGLQMARQLMASQDTRNRQVILITDGLPTAHFDGSTLFMLYPPDPLTEEATMREGRLCAREGIVVNIFLLPSWSQSHEDVQFAHRLAEQTGGRVFFTAGRDLDRFVVWDYVSHRRDII